MCGISGFIGDFDRDLLLRMNAAIAHRGPDDSCFWYSAKDGIGLAHRRLSIIDLSHNGRQPMWDSHGETCIVYNGEIYNYRELRDELRSSGVRFRSESDTEVLLHLYRKQGAGLLSRLNGIFAFALYDANDGSLMMARDGLGVKPLYYAFTPKGFLFSSELKSIVQYQSIDKTLDESALQAYLTYLWSPGERTPFKAIRKLEPGHAMIIGREGLRKTWSFYSLPYDQPIRETLTAGDAAEELRCLLRKAVERQMVSDVPVGAFLSGGLDSSSVVAFAREFSGPEPLRCFTIGMKDASLGNDGMAEDLPFAQRVSSELGVKLETVLVGTQMIDELEKVIYHLDEPQADPAPINVYFISRLARQHGIKVLLSGAGGDDLFTGYRRHVALMHERYWSWLPLEVRRGMATAASHMPTGTPLGRRINKAFRYADLEGDNRIVSYFRWTSPEDVFALCRPIGPFDSSNCMLESLKELAGVPNLNKMLFLEGRYFLADHNLNYTDKAAMANGVEVRVPLLDPDVVRFAASLPLHMKQHGTTGKWIFKKAMDTILSREVIHRPKTGFGAPLRGWLKGPLSRMVEDVLSDSNLRSRGLFEPAAVKDFVRRDNAGSIDGTYTIFSLICIELWLRLFADRVPAIDCQNAVEIERPIRTKNEPTKPETIVSTGL